MYESVALSCCHWRRRLELVSCEIQVYARGVLFFQAEDGIRDLVRSRGLGDVYKRQLFAIKKTPKFASGFSYEDNWYSLDYEKRSKLARNKIWLYEDSEIPSLLSNESRDFLNSLEEYAVIQSDKINIFISHFCYPDFSGSSIFFPEQPFHLKKHFEFTQNLNCKISFSGHGHPEGCVFINEDKLSLYKFGEHKISNNNCWMVTPCVAKTTRKNGVLIFDTNNFTIRILELNSF